MTDYIRRDDALFVLRKAERGGSMTALTRLERAYAEIREMPAADVAEVVHAQWEDNSIPEGSNRLHELPVRFQKGCALEQEFLSKLRGGDKPHKLCDVCKRTKRVP